MEVNQDRSNEALPYCKVEDSDLIHSTFDSLSSVREIRKEELEAQLPKISHKKPRKAFDFFKKEHWTKGKTMSENNTECSKIWKTLPESEKEKYKKMAAENKIPFSETQMWSKTHILQKPYDKNASASDIFIKEHLRPFCNKKEKKELTKHALELWVKLTDDEKKIYEEKRKQNLALYDEKAGIQKNVTGYSYKQFFKDQIALASEIGETKTLSTCELSRKSESKIIDIN